jgi:hypothetical protein
MSENNLSNLNDVLFDTLRKLNENKISTDKAKSIVDVSNSIINNAKTQLTAFKMVKGKTAPPTIIGLPSSTGSSVSPGDNYEQMSDFALKLGYENVASAIATLGKDKFKTRFRDEYVK